MIPLAHGPIFKFNLVKSTMDTAFSILQKDTLHGTALIASHQTMGRGRQGKIWKDRGAESLLTTILLQASSLARYSKSGYGHCAIRAAWAVARVIARIMAHSTGITIKWPNDVLIHDKKITGILIESRKNWIGLGIGINVGQRVFPADLQSTATSIALENGSAPPLSVLFHYLRDELDYTLSSVDLADNLGAHLWCYGKQVYAKLPSGASVSGIHRGITDEGALLLETESGMREIVSASLFRFPPEGFHRAKHTLVE